MSNLKECPFCNGIPIIHSKCNEEETNNTTMYFVRCTNCGAKTAWTFREDSAEELWNMRGGKNER